MTKLPAFFVEGLKLIRNHTQSLKWYVRNKTETWTDISDESQRISRSPPTLHHKDVHSDLFEYWAPCSGFGIKWWQANQITIYFNKKRALDTYSVKLSLLKFILRIVG